MFIVLASSLGAALIFRWVRLPLWPLTGGLVGAASVNLGFDLGFRAPESFLVAAQLLIGTARSGRIFERTYCASSPAYFFLARSL